MRKQLVKALTTISFLVALAIVTTGSAYAVSPIKVQVPFDFVVANKTLPAGLYFVSRVQPYASDDALEIRSADGHINLICLTYAAQSLDPKNDVTLVFHRYGEQHFLFQVWSAGDSRGRVFSKSRGELEILRRTREATIGLRKNAPAVETVTVTGTSR